MPFAEEAKKYGPFARILYGMILRNLIKKAIDDPDDEWDDLVLDKLDDIFDYNE